MAAKSVEDVKPAAASVKTGQKAAAPDVGAQVVNYLTYFRQRKLAMYMAQAKLLKEMKVRNGTGTISDFYKIEQQYGAIGNIIRTITEMETLLTTGALMTDSADVSTDRFEKSVKSAGEILGEIVSDKKKDL